MEQPRSAFRPFLHHFLVESACRAHNQRAQSEDALLIDGETGLLGIFDAVGGRDRGRQVAQLASQTIAAAWHSLAKEEEQRSCSHLEERLPSLIQQADTAIASLALPPEEKRPGTTAVLGVLSWQQTQASLTVAHIGDSRAYLLRAGQPLQRLTEDHGYFSFAVQHGRLTSEEGTRIEQAERKHDLSSDELEHFARRNKITCAVGWSDFSHIPARTIALRPGDCLFFCTDGVHDNLTDREIEAVLGDAGEPSAQRLVNAAYERSHQDHLRAKPDDISVIVVWYPPVGGA